MSDMPTGLLLADANSLAYAFKAGGVDLLNAYVAAAKAEGLTFAITDQVMLEVEDNFNTGVQQWLTDNNIKVVSTETAAAVASGQLSGADAANAGEKSMLEIMEEGIADGERVVILSDDRFFTEVQNITNSARVFDGELSRGFAVPPEYVEASVVLSKDMMATTGITNNLSKAAYEAAVAGYEAQSAFDPTNLSNDRLSNFAPWEKIEAVQDGLARMKTAGALGEDAAGLEGASFTLGKFAAGTLKTVGLAAIAYDALTSTAKANELLQNGDNEGAAKTLADLAARLYFGFKGAELGAALFAAPFAETGPGALIAGFIGGLVGGVAGVIGGQAAVDAIWQETDELLKQLNSVLGGGDSERALELALDFIGRMALGLVGTLGFEFAGAVDKLFPNLPDLFHSAMRDPIVLDLNGNGIDLTSLSGSNVHFDYAGDGFAERTGWVAPTDGILAIDLNGNGKIDNGLELFGSPTEDGFAVLEKLDTNGDGVIDANDADFSKLLVWRDLNQNGVSDPGELESLADAGIASISLRTQKVNGTNAGNNLGYQATFTRTDGATGTAETIYFSTDTQDSVADNTPDFTPSDDALSVPQLPGSGLINSIAFKATNDPNFLAAWTALTDAAPNLSPAELNSQFKDLLLRWAGVDGVDPVSRGPNVDARHLAFLEKFYGTIYLNDHDSGVPLNWQGRLLEQEFASIVAIYETAFLAQVGASSLIRGTGDISAALNNPYFFYSLLDFNSYAADDPAAPATPGNVGMVVQLMLAMAPDAAGAQTDYLIKGLSGLTGVIGAAFGGDKAAYAATLEPLLEDGIADDTNRAIATQIVDGTALFGTTKAEGINGTSGADVLIGEGGGDLLNGGNGSDIYVYNKQDGNLWIKDYGAATDTDRLVLTDLNSSDVTFDRVGSDLLMRPVNQRRFYQGGGLGENRTVQSAATRSVAAKF